MDPSIHDPITYSYVRYIVPLDLSLLELVR